MHRVGVKVTVCVARLVSARGFLGKTGCHEESQGGDEPDNLHAFWKAFQRMKSHMPQMKWKSVGNAYCISEDHGGKPCPWRKVSFSSAVKLEEGASF